MKKVLKWIGIVFGVIGVVMVGLVAYVQIDGIPKYPVATVALRVQPSADRVARGKKLASMLCAECHMDQETGGLTGKQMVDAPPQFGRIFSRNITKDSTHGIGQWSDSEIAYLLRTGVRRNGQYTPPWMAKVPHLSDTDLAAIVAFLRSDDPWVAPRPVPSRDSEPTFLTKALTHGPFKPLPYPDHAIADPDPNDAVALGRYYIANFECYQCHSADFKTNDTMHPEKSKGFLAGGNRMLDSNGRGVYTSNITFDEETGIAKYSKEQFRRAVRESFRPDNSPIIYPMPRYAELEDFEVDAIYEYLKTVPKIRNTRPANEAAPGTQTPISEAEKAYRKYACNACHGDNGAGSCDLRQATTKYPQDEQLVAFVKKPSAVVSGSKMPSWEGVIQDSEYPLLVQHVRKLCSQRYDHME